MVFPVTVICTPVGYRVISLDIRGTDTLDNHTKSSAKKERGEKRHEEAGRRDHLTVRLSEPCLWLNIPITSLARTSAFSDSLGNIMCVNITLHNNLVPLAKHELEWLQFIDCTALLR